MDAGIFAGLGIGMLLFVCVAWIFVSGVIWLVFGSLRDLLWGKYTKKQSVFFDLLVTLVIAGLCVTLLTGGGVTILGFVVQVVMAALAIAWALYIVFPFFKWKTPVG